MSSTLGTTRVGPAWVHIAYTKSGTTHNVYLDGKLELTATQDIEVLLPAVLVAYTNIVADASLPTVPRQSLLTAIKSWKATLTQFEIGIEIAAGHRAFRRTRLTQEAYLTGPADLDDFSGNNFDFEVDTIKSGTLKQAVGPKGLFPRIPRVPTEWAGKGGAIAPNITGAAIGDAVAIASSYTLDDLDAFTLMGWFLVPTTTTPTKPVPLLRLANDDAIGGSSEISIGITTTGVLTLNLGLLPSISAGASQIAAAPIPSVVTLTGVSTAGSLFLPIGFLWQLVEGPADVTIGTPTALSTTVTFTAYVPGTYTFQLTGTYTNPRGTTVAVRATVSVLLPVAAAPRVESGSQQILWPTATTTLTPTIVDDGWSGTVTYLWEQIQGPLAAIIAAPTAASTLITVTNVPGTYIFRLTVRNNTFITRAFWRVPVITSVGATEADTVQDVTILVGVTSYSAQLGSIGISETPNENANTCQFKIKDVKLPLFTEVIVKLGATVIFAGHINRRSQQDAELPEHVFYNVNLIGYEWNFMRRRVSKRYVNESIYDIAVELVAMVPGGFTTTLIDPDLGTVEEISFYNATIGEALTALAKQAGDGAAWKVYYDKRVSLGVMEITSLDPTPLTVNHPSFSNLVISSDGSQQYNRVISEGRGANVAADTDAGSTEIKVTDLDAFSDTGGLARAGAQRIAYTGVKTVPVTIISVASTTLSGGSEGLSNSGVYESSQIFEYSEADIAAEEAATGQIYQWTDPGTYTYFITYITLYGESTWVDTFQITSAYRHWVQFVPPAFPDGVLRMNIYRSLKNAAWPPTATYFINQLSAQIDAWDVFGDVDLLRVYPSPPFPENVHRSLPTEDHSLPAQTTSSGGSAKAPADYYLTGVTGLTEDLVNGDPINIYVQVDDTAAQAALAAILLNGDDGVIEAYLRDNNISEVEATLRAEAYLNDHRDEDTGLDYDSRDQNTHPNNIISAYLTAPTNLSGDFKIQSVEVSQFEKGVPLAFAVRASKLHTPIERLLSQIGGNGIETTGAGGKQNSVSGAVATGSISGGASPKTVSRPTYKTIAWAEAPFSNQANHSVVGLSTFTALGGTATSFVDTTRSWSRNTTNASLNSACGFAYAGNDFGWVDHLPFLELYFRTGNPISNIRFFFGIAFNTPSLVTDDLSLMKGVGIRYFSTLNDPGFLPVTSTGTAGSQLVGTAPINRGGVKSSTIYRLGVQVKSLTSFTCTVNGSSQAFAMPAIGSTLMNIFVKMVTADGIAKYFDFGAVYTERR